MDIKETITQLAGMGGRVFGKAEAVIDCVNEADKAQAARAKAKNAKDFDKLKKDCLTSVAEGEKALKAWQPALDDWDKLITGLEKEVAAEDDNIAQKVKETDAVNKAIDEANAKIKAHNKDLALGERDPRAQPYIERSNAVSKLSGATTALIEAWELAKKHRTTWKGQKDWGSGAAEEFKKTKDRATKDKFKAPK